MQDTNLKISPYFDDFDRSKNYQKVLFKPGYSVQTRELNTLQSTLQNQVERFGQHIFKEGSVVIPGNISFNLNFKAVLVQGLINGISVESYRTNLKGKVLTGASSGVKAEVLDTISAADSERETITLYVKYISSGNTEDNTQLSLFKNNEVLSDEEGTPVAVTSVQNATSYTGSSATISAGVYFIRGFFVEVATQKIILDQYNNKPSYKIGLQINESLVTSDDDSTLFDNALGSNNFASPGADRLKIEPKLVKQNLSFSTSSDFIELLRLENGKSTLTALSEDSVYNELEKNLARRTFDESGDYTVKPYTFRVREALNDGSNGGVYLPNERIFDGRTIVRSRTAETPADAIVGDDYYAIELSSGKAYVKGFEVNNDKKQIAIVEKPRQTNTFNNSGSALNIGSYFKVTDSTAIGAVQFSNRLNLLDVDGTEIGRAIALGYTKGKLYVTEVSTYETLTITTGQSHNFASGDFVSGQTSGASAFVKSISGQSVTVEQVNGTFVTGESLVGSRYTTVTTTINTISRKRLENVRSIAKNGGGFSISTTLEPVKISGTSFKIASGNTLTGVSTLFESDVYTNSKLQIGTSETEVNTVSSTSVVVADTLDNGTYYDVKKLITKLYTSPNGLTNRISARPVKNISDYSSNRLVYTGEYTTLSNGDFIIQAPATETILKDSVIITSSSGVVAATLTQPSGSNNVINVDTALSAGTPVSVYYNSRVSNPKSKKKEKKSDVFLIVDKLKDGTANDGNIYGTRIQDKEISLKFPDVIKVHSIHQAVRDGDSNEAMFDSLVLNTVNNLKTGDIIETTSVKARIISINAGQNKVFITYIGTSKFESGDNLAIEVQVPTNSDADRTIVRQSSYGRYIDVTDDFIFSRNDSSDSYKPSKLVRRFNAAVPTKKLIVILDYFEHQNLSNDFYSAESYGSLTYKDIPKSYNSVSMADIIDYRIYTPVSTITSSTQKGTISQPHREVSNVFNVYTHTYTTQPFPYPGSVFNADTEFYLGRNDSIYLTKDGNLKILKGADSVEPKSTYDKSVGLLLGSVELPPYLKSVYDAKVTIEENRHYTMRDIGKLDKRLSNVENYTTLSLLETNTNNLNVLDEDGKNRFKNGFVVDNFRSTDVADTANVDYTASIDVSEGYVRPYPYVNNVGFTFNSYSSTSVQTGDYITIPYTEVSYVSQPYASRVENVTPFESFSYIGEMTLTPKKDIWYDTQREIIEGQNINLTDSISTLFDLVVPGGIIWDEWQLGAGGSTRDRPGGTTITDIRSGTQYEVGNLDVDLESGDTINQVTDIKYARSRIVDLSTKSLKPVTDFSLFINDFNATNYTYPKVLSGLTNQNANRFAIGETVRIWPNRRYTNQGLARCTQYGGNFDQFYLTAVVADPRTFLSSSQISSSDFTEANGYSPTTKILCIDNVQNWDGESTAVDIGQDFTIEGQTSLARTVFRSSDTNKLKLTSNTEGTLEAFVILPTATFETGDLEFKLSDDPDNIQVKNLTNSYSIGYYYSQGTQLDVSSTITTLDVPQLSVTSVEDDRTRFIPDPPPPPPPPPPGGGGGGDPLAQSFVIDEVGGLYATSLDLYFLTKDTVEPVTLELRTMVSGNPTATVVPGSVVTLPASSINTSNDASVATRFAFPHPIYLSDTNEYAFVVKSSSQKYNLWVSRLGEQDVSSGVTIDRQPHVGVVFKSANQSTWISDQYEDIKFNLNRAKFTTGTTYSVVLNNKPVPTQKLQTNALSMTNGSSVIKVTQPNHGMLQTQNKVTISGVLSETSTALLASDVSTNSTSVTINDITNSTFTASTVEGWATINNQPVSSSNAGFIRIGTEVISYTGISGNTLTGCVRGALNTTAAVHVVETPVECFQVNGIPLNQINTSVDVTKVLSLDEYEITVAYSANETKRCGGSEIRASRNIPYEIIQPNISSLVPQDTVASVQLSSVTGTSIGNSGQTSFVSKPFESIENRAENKLADPRLVLSPINNTTYGSGAPGSLNTIINLSTSNDFLSPLIDLEGSSITTISNRLTKTVDSNNVLDLDSELLPSGGKHSAYITKRVVLENESTSIKVLFDAIRTGDNDIKVFVKVKGDSQPGSFDNMNYVEVPALSYPASETNKQYRAFDFELKNMTEFQEFSVKIVMIGNDMSNVPYIKNFRAMALAI